jgi:diadenosine tetraphosphate (Ap4A) HIT family hydrolase
MSNLSPHPTLLKFGYPDTLVHEGRHWALLVRPVQPTLGSLVLCALDPVESYAALSADAFGEQRELIGAIERTLRAFSQYQRINYLMLMMVDPHVHFHVLPRYEGERIFDGKAFVDEGWPALPILSKGQPVSSKLIEALRSAWKAEVKEGF